MIKRLSALMGLLLLCSCGTQQSRAGVQLEGPFTAVQSLAHFSEHGINVLIELEHDHRGNVVIASTYTPQDADIHLYSKDLPRHGIDGAGRPTLLELPAQASAQALGSVVADKPVYSEQLKGFKTAFPIYPDGPVTLRLPIGLTSQEGRSEIELRLTYMGCSSKGYCLPPVVDKKVSVISNTALIQR